MKKIFALFILILSCIFTTTIFAEGEVDVVTDIDTLGIRVSGNVGKTSAMQEVTMVLVLPGKSAPSLDENDGEQIVSDSFAVWKQTTADANGSYTFDEFKVKESGEYNIIVSAANSDSVYSVVKFLPNEGAYSDILDSTENGTASDIFNVLEGAKQSLGLLGNVDIYYGLENTDKTKVCQSLKDNAPYATIKDLVSQLNKSAVGVDILATKSAKNVLNYIEPEGKGFSEDIENAIKDTMRIEQKQNISPLKHYMTLSDAEKGDVASFIASTQRKSLDDFYKSLYLGVIKGRLSSVANWAEINGILNEHNDVLVEIDYTKYNSSYNRSDVDKAVMAADFTSIEELCNFVNNTVNSYKKTAQNSSSFGGISSGGSSSSYPVPVAVPYTEEERSPEASLFNDIDAVAWAKEAIESLAENGIVEGDGSGGFLPNEPVKREAFVKMIVLAMELDLNADSDFSDVPKNDWAYPYVSAAVKSGYINGISDTLFGRGQNITREDMGVIIARALNLEESDEKSDFTDADIISDYAIGSIEAVCQKGIINGMDDGSFAPKQNLTRAQAAVVIYRMLTSN